MAFAKTVAAVMTGMVAIGGILSFAGKGNLGASAQKIARFITDGYGV